MAQDLLKVEHLAASVEDAEILKDVSLRIGRGETHVIMGPNGAGKSTLAGVLMGNPEIGRASCRERVFRAV